MITLSQFLGSWRLVSSEFKLSDGNILYPLGPRVVGRLHYDVDGGMSAQLYRAGRTAFSQGDQATATDKEIREAYTSSVCYFGRYQLDVEKQTITHFVEGSLFPNWIDGEQLRNFRFEDGKLHLSTPPILMNNVMQTGELVWERCS